VKRKKIEAEGISSFEKIVTEGINENLLKWKGIEATKELALSGNAKVVVIGAGKEGLPIILGGDYAPAAPYPSPPGR
jgi:prohibitin 1